MLNNKKSAVWLVCIFAIIVVIVAVMLLSPGAKKGLKESSFEADALTENITLEYSDESGVYTESYIKKTAGNSVTLFDENNKEIVSGEDVIALPYVYAVKTNGKYDLLDKETLTKTSGVSYDEIFCERYPDGRLSTIIIKGRVGEYWGLISSEGETLTNPQEQSFEDIQINTYEEAWPIISVKQEGKYGAIDYTGKMVIEVKWDYLAMDVYNVANTVFVLDGIKWGGIRLDKDLSAAEVDYNLPIPKWIVESYEQNFLGSDMVNSAQLVSMFDFAMKYRFDYVPYFAEGNAPQSSSEYLFYAFAVNLENWGGEKGIMSKKYVEEIIDKHFEVESVVHKSLRKGWDFDGVKYIAIPSSIKEKPFYVLKNLKVSTKNNKTVYEAVVDECILANRSLAGEEDIAKIRAEIKEGDFSSLVSLKGEETFTYYLNDKGEPVFIAHISNDRPVMKWYYQMFRNDSAFRVLGSSSGDFTDDQLATYAVLKMGDKAHGDGNTKEEFNAITQKYFGRDISNFENGSTETIPGTDKVRATGWSYDNSMFVIAKDIWNNEDGSMTGDFYCINISDSYWTGQAGEFEQAEKAMLNGDITPFANCNISLKRITYEVKSENGQQYFKYHSVQNLQEKVDSIVLYSR